MLLQDCSAPNQSEHEDEEAQKANQGFDCSVPIVVVVLVAVSQIHRAKDSTMDCWQVVVELVQQALSLADRLTA